MKKKIVLLSILFSLIGPALVEAEGIAVIVNEKNGASDISIKDLNWIYRGVMQEWPSGQSIVVVNRGAQSDIRRGFYKGVLRARPTQRFFLPGSSIPFRTIVQKSAIGTTRFVASDERAVGYVYLNEITGEEAGIRVLKVDGVMPSESTIKSGSYKLR